MPQMPTYNMALEVLSAAQTVENRVGHLAAPVLAGRDFGEMTLATLNDARRQIESARDSLDAVIRVIRVRADTKDRERLQGVSLGLEIDRRFAQGR